MEPKIKEIDDEYYRVLCPYCKANPLYSGRRPNFCSACGKKFKWTKPEFPDFPEPKKVDKKLVKEYVTANNKKISMQNAEIVSKYIKKVAKTRFQVKKLLEKLILSVDPRSRIVIRSEDIKEFKKR